MSIQSSADDASTLRLWAHSVGVVNTVHTVGTDPTTGLRGASEEPGMGVAGRWGQNHFILTARHVLEKARPRDLRLFCRPDGGLKYRPPLDITKQDVVKPIPLSELTCTIHRCHWEDLALVTTAPRAVGRNTEFFDIANAWVDPREGETVHCFGTPRSHSVVLHSKQIGDVVERTLALIPTVFSSEVLPCPNEDELRFKITAFDPKRHYLIAYGAATKGQLPHGISGAAIWVESNEPQIVWAPRFKFAGICTVCYKSGTVEQVVKASTVRRFLREVFGKAPKGKTKVRSTDL